MTIKIKMEGFLFKKEKWVSEKWKPHFPFLIWVFLTSRLLARGYKWGALNYALIKADIRIKCWPNKSNIWQSVESVAGAHIYTSTLKLIHWEFTSSSGKVCHAELPNHQLKTWVKLQLSQTPTGWWELLFLEQQASVWGVNELLEKWSLYSLIWDL